ncbi:MAG: hypothetical protein JJU20_11700, partial [Opitutales bacterium]|nr:hypothetical protein [Opitutales bacterium]
SSVQSKAPLPARGRAFPGATDASSVQSKAPLPARGRTFPGGDGRLVRPTDPRRAVGTTAPR